MASKIKRVTNKQKKIINHILEHGLNSCYYDNDFVEDMEYSFKTSREEIEACVEYVEDKFKFWKY